MQRFFRMMFLWIIAIVFLALLAYVRFAPSDPAVWHVEPKVVEDRDYDNKSLRRIEVGMDGLRRIDAIIAAEPRTQVLAGSVEQGMITYITRSRMMGYPDYTTILQNGHELLIFARSRFGRKDFGVNRERIERWIGALTAY